MATIGLGSNTVLAFDFEDTPGTSPGTPDGRSLAFVSENIRGNRPTMRNESITGDANPRDPVLGRQDVSGELVIIPNLVNLPLLAKWITGDLTTTGGPDYIHTAKFAKAGTSMVTAVLETKFDLDTDLYKLINGAAVETFSGEVTDAGFLQFSLGVSGFKTTKQTSALDASLSDMTAAAVFNHGQIASADCKFGGSQTTRLASASWNLNTNLFKDVYPVGQGSVRAALPRGVAALTGTIRTYVDDAAFWDIANAGTFTSLDLKWTIAANQYVQIFFPRILLSKSDPVVSGPGALMAEFQFEGSKDGTEATVMKIVVGNQSASTVYA